MDKDLDEAKFPGIWPNFPIFRLVYGKIPKFSYVLHFQLLILEAGRPISLKRLCLLVWNIPWLKREWGLVG